MSAANLSGLPYTRSWYASDPPRATVVYELCVISLSIYACSGSSMRISKPLSRGCPVPPWWVAIVCSLYVVQQA